MSELCVLRRDEVHKCITNVRVVLLVPGQVEEVEETITILRTSLDHCRHHILCQQGLDSTGREESQLLSETGGIDEPYR